MYDYLVCYFCLSYCVFDFESQNTNCAFEKYFKCLRSLHLFGYWFYSQNYESTVLYVVTLKMPDSSSLLIS